MGRVSYKLVDWKRNNKIAMRNFSKAVDFHDIVKLLIVRKLRRKYPDSHSVPIYTEHDARKPNLTYPDIWMRIKAEIYVWEIQDKITQPWKIGKMHQYEDVDLIIVPLKKLSSDLNLLDGQLEDYII